MQSAIMQRMKQAHQNLPHVDMRKSFYFLFLDPERDRSLREKINIVPPPLENRIAHSPNPMRRDSSTLLTGVIKMVINNTTN